MKEKKPVGPHKLLKICRRLFFSGALTMLAAAYLIGESYQWRGNDVPVFLWITAGVGILIMAGSLLTAFSKLRCPYCGAMNEPGAEHKYMQDLYKLMPSSLPHFCPDCGKTLDDCD